jgi:hypothetical protein
MPGGCAFERSANITKNVKGAKRTKVSWANEESFVALVPSTSFVVYSDPYPARSLNASLRIIPTPVFVAAKVRSEQNKVGWSRCVILAAG